MRVEVEIWERGEVIGSYHVNTLTYHTEEAAREFMQKFNSENGKTHTKDYYVIAKIGRIWP